MSIYAIAIPLFLYLAGIIGLVYPLVWLQKRRKKGKRSPLTSNLVRSPGTTLQGHIEDLSLDIMAYISVFPALPLMFYALFLPQFIAKKLDLITLCILLIMGFGTLIWVGFKVYRLMTERNQYRLGLDAEMAIGQELNQLMLKGCRVFHDFPAENFNIDHVIVGPGGVYAVETKGRAKPDKGRGTKDAEVIYDGKVLQFPDWHETKPLDQAKRQAAWLSKWLSSAVGSTVSAIPALALPGWYVNRVNSGGVVVFNGKNPFFLAKPNGRMSLNEQQIKQISHQIEQRCRDVEPTAYRT